VLLKKLTAGIDTVAYQSRFQVDRLRSTEECFYHSVLMEQFEDPQAILANVGRWQID